jgi:hypothetical protein
MSPHAPTKTDSILRDRWRHNRKLLDTVRNAKRESSVPLKQEKAADLLKEYPKKNIKQEPIISDK